MAERGMQLADPFYSVWSSEWGATVAVSMDTVVGWWS